MSITDPPSASLLEIAEHLRLRQISPTELLDATLARISSRDGALHSFLTVIEDEARNAASAAEAEIAAGRYRGPLHGVPVGIKDLCATKGVRTTCASPVLADNVPDYDASVVERLRAAGAILVGKLNLTEFALAGYHPDLPIPVNPWNPNCNAGGSSSGSAVAVAAGLCFGAIGTDTGGSIRIPSAWNGVVGLKPTYGRVSRHGVFPLAMSLDHIGPMTRRVADAAAMFETMAGADPRDPTCLPLPAPKVLSKLEDSVRGLRVGYDERYARDGSMPDVGAAVEAVGEVLRKAGAEVVAVTVPPLDGVLDAWFPLCAADALVAHENLFPARASLYGEMFRTFLEYGTRLSAADYARAHDLRLRFAGGMRTLFASCDALLCPGAFSTAPPAMAIDPYSPFTTDIAPFLRYSGPFNFSGSPTLSFPCGFSPDGMPYGAQLVGRHLQEDVLLRLGHAYERATQWPTLARA